MTLFTAAGMMLAGGLVLSGAWPRASERPGQVSFGPVAVSGAAGSYRHGRELLARGDSTSLTEALGQFQEALDLDPSNAEAYAGRAAAYVALGCAGFLPPSAAFPKARAAAQTALQLDSSLTEPHASMATSASCRPPARSP